MNLNDAKEIIDCLPKGKTRFYYFKDRYALLLLSLGVADQATKKEISRTRFAKLLHKQVVKEAIRRSRDSLLSPDTFNSYWPLNCECYFLSLGTWGSKRGSWNQTSRPGYNLVLQLNFSSAHDEPYQRLIDPEDERPFSFYSHPIADGTLRTLAWARLDIDLHRGEALIEEIQTDWIRDALTARRQAQRVEDSLNFYGVEMNRDRLIRYVDSILRIHQQTWDEAMLAASIWFLRAELGVKTIFYHTHESGARLKRISHRLPPRSVYSKLPKQFCFLPTKDRPGFLPGKARPSRANPRYDNALFSVLELDGAGRPVL